MVEPDMVEITIKITKLEFKGLAYVAVNPVEWITNFTQVRARAALQEIYDNEIQKLRADPNVKTIPISVEEVAEAADIKSAAERQIEFTMNPPIPPAPPEPKQ